MLQAQKHKLLGGIAVYLWKSAVILIMALMLSMGININHTSAYGHDQLRITGTNMCLDVPAADYRSGVQLTVWQCYSGGNQRFIYVGNTIRPVYAQHLCVDALGYMTYNGVAIGLWECNGKLNQAWTPIVHPGYTTQYRSDMTWNGPKCIDASLPMYNSSKVHLWDCYNGYNQMWHWQ